MKEAVRIISAALICAAMVIPFSGCDEGNANTQNAAASTVIGIEQQAMISQLEADAAQIDAACNDYYAGVTAGTITSSDSKAQGAAAPGSTVAKRKAAAKSCTIGNALKYAGMESMIPKLNNYSISPDGTIFYVRSDQTSQRYKVDTTLTEKFHASLSNMTFGELYNKI